MPLRAGVDLGGTKIQSVVTDDQHTVLGQARHPTPKDDGPQGVADGIVAAIREALERSGGAACVLECF
jgi:glucokinase